MAIDICKT